MNIVGLYCILNIRTQFAGYHTETQYMTEFNPYLADVENMVSF